MFPSKGPVLFSCSVEAAWNALILLSGFVAPVMLGRGCAAL